MILKVEGEYEIRSMKEDDFLKLQSKLQQSVFESDHSIFPMKYFTEDEKNKIRVLSTDLYNNQYKLYLGVFDKSDNMIGWHWGYQESAHVFYMCNSAILPEHRRSGIYSNLLKYVIEILAHKGFQIILSRHCATNNAVIIPKLKAGFVIAGLEVNDVFGVLVNLKYFANKTRRKIMDYRSGQLAPDEELRKLF